MIEDSDARQTFFGVFLHFESLHHASKEKEQFFLCQRLSRAKTFAHGKRYHTLVGYKFTGGGVDEPLRFELSERVALGNNDQHL